MSGNILYEYVIDRKPDWISNPLNEVVYNFTGGRSIEGVFIVNESNIDSVIMYPDGKVNEGNAVIVGVRQPFYGKIASGHMIIRPNGLSMSQASTTEQTLVLGIYLNGTPYEMPRRRDMLMRHFDTGPGASAAFNRVYGVRGRKWGGLHYRISTDATVGNRVVTINGLRVVAGETSAAQLIATTTYPASTGVTDVFVAINPDVPSVANMVPYDGIEVNLTTTGGTHDFRGSLYMLDD